MAEVIAGVLDADNPLERAELALKIIPGEHARELVSAISGAMRLESSAHRAAPEDSTGLEDSRRLFRRIRAVLELGQELLDGPGAKSPHACELLGRTLERLLTIQRSFISTGLDAYLNQNHGLNDAHDGVLMFEKAVATREIQWRLRETARDLALHTAALAGREGAVRRPDRDARRRLRCDPAAHAESARRAPKLAALSPTSFAGSLGLRELTRAYSTLSLDSAGSGFGITELHVLQDLEQQGRHQQVAVGFRIGRNHVPRRVIGVGGDDGALVGLLVLVPLLALDQVVRIELPLLVRIVEALLQALALLVLGNVQEQLDDDGAGFASACARSRGCAGSGACIPCRRSGPARR